MIRWARKSEEQSDLFRIYRRRYPHHYRKWEYPWCHYNAGVTPGMRLLDAGGGDSIFLENYLGLGCECVSTSDPNYIRIPKGRHPGISIVAERMQEMSFPDASFDRVFCQGVMEHVSRPERALCLKSLARVLKPGGLLLMSYDYFYPANLLPRYADVLQTLFFRLDISDRRNVDGREMLDSVPELEPWQAAFRDPVFGDPGFEESFVSSNPDILQNMIPLLEGAIYLTFVGMALYKPYRKDELFDSIPLLSPLHVGQHIGRAPILKYVDGSKSFRGVMEAALGDVGKDPLLKSRIPETEAGFLGVFNEMIKDGYISLRAR